MSDNACQFASCRSGETPCLQHQPYVNMTVGTHTGPWAFEQALTCMKAGGKVRRRSLPGFWLRFDDEKFIDQDDNRPILSINAEHLLACDWEPVS